MKKTAVNIDFEIMAIALKQYVKATALKAGSKIVYKENGVLIEENPSKKTKNILVIK